MKCGFIPSAGPAGWGVSPALRAAKKIFGDQASKPLLIDFLNALLPQTNKIVDLSFKNTEQLLQTESDR